MQCLYCTKQFSLASRIFHDSDFCSPAHRGKFNQQLHAAIGQIEESSALRPTALAGFYPEKREFEPASRSAVPAGVAVTSTVWSAASYRISLAQGVFLQPVMDIPLGTFERGTARQPADRDIRLQQVSEMIAELREEVQRRDSASKSITRNRALAPIIKLKRAM